MRRNSFGHGSPRVGQSAHILAVHSLVLILQLLAYLAYGSLGIPPPAHNQTMAPEATIEAWYMDDSAEDQRLPHRKEPNEPATMEKLAQLGVLYWKLDADNWRTDEKLKKIREERGYSYEDCITCTPEKLPNYEAKIKTFFEEHLHTDEEIRYVLDGSGYFDVRDVDERWIRIDCRKGDLIVLPAGIYHRFTLDTNNYIMALRLFVGEPVWTPYNRPADEMDARKTYVKDFVQKAVPAQ